jgi:uncharacterized FlaG/YvyC family protein
MSANPLSVTGGAGPIIPASLANHSTHTNTAQQTQAAADTIGPKPTKDVDHNVNQLYPLKQNSPTENNVKGASAASAVPQDEESMTVEEAEKTFQEYLNNLPSDMKFHFDKEASRVIFKLVNPVTQEVLREFPPDEFISMVKRLKAAEQKLTGKGNGNGVLFDDRS